MTDVLCLVPQLRTRLRRTFGVALLASVCGCAVQPNADPRDPMEAFNRGVFAFNEDADRVIFKPVAIVYREAVPSLARAGVSNFFGNLEDLWSFFNNVLQFKGRAAADSLARVGVNSFFGIGGVFDVASEMRIERQKEDFGQTLGRWGVAPGPYLVLPFLGATTLRDAVALPVDFMGDVVTNLNHIPTRNSLKVLDLIDTRSSLLSVSSSLDEVALDKYSFTRDAILQRRRNAVYDGNPPDEPMDARPSPR